MPTLQLFDPQSQFTTIDFVGSTSHLAVIDSLVGFGGAGDSFVPFRSREGQFTQKSFNINIIGSSESTLRDNYEALGAALNVARLRYERDPKNAVALITSNGTSTSTGKHFRVRDGWVVEPRTVLSPYMINQNKVINATLVLVLEAIGEQAATGTNASSALENEVDGAAVNYFDLNLTGDDPEQNLVNLKIIDTNMGSTDAWDGSRTVWAFARQGEDSTKNVFFQDASTDPVETTTLFTGAVVTANSSAGYTPNASQGQSAGIIWDGNGSNRTASSEGWKEIAYFPIVIPSTALPDGKFRVLTRVNFDTPTSTNVTFNSSEIGLAVGYKFGATTQTPIVGGSLNANKGDAVILNSTRDTGITTAWVAEWRTKDIGEIVSPPIEIGSTLGKPDLEVRAYLHLFTNSQILGATEQFRVSVDYSVLADTRFNFAQIDNVSSSNVIQIVSHRKTVGVFLTTTADVVDSIPDYNATLPWLQGNEGAMRYSFLRDDPRDPSLIQFDITHVHVTRTRGSF